MHVLHRYQLLLGPFEIELRLVPFGLCGGQLFAEQRRVHQLAAGLGDGGAQLRVHTQREHLGRVDGDASPLGELMGPAPCSYAARAPWGGVHGRVQLRVRTQFVAARREEKKRREEAKGCRGKGSRHMPGPAASRGIYQTVCLNPQQHPPNRGHHRYPLPVP